jgi:hypothetical protein
LRPVLELEFSVIVRGASLRKGDDLFPMAPSAPAGGVQSQPLCRARSAAAARAWQALSRASLNALGHRFLAGHRGTAISIACWPPIWPTPERVTLTVHVRHAARALVRLGRAWTA